jgi:phage terminase large subunit GpA-like protein
MERDDTELFVNRVRYDAPCEHCRKKAQLELGISRESDAFRIFGDTVMMLCDSCACIFAGMIMDVLDTGDQT